MNEVGEIKNVWDLEDVLRKFGVPEQVINNIILNIGTDDIVIMTKEQFCEILSQYMTWEQALKIWEEYQRGLHKPIELGGITYDSKDYIYNNDNFNELFNKAFTEYVKEYQDIAKEQINCDDAYGNLSMRKAIRLIKSDLEDKGFNVEETKDMIYGVVFSEPSDEKHPNRYFIKDFERCNPILNENLRDKFNAYRLETIKDYEDMEDVRETVKEIYDIDLSKKESEKLFDDYKSFGNVEINKEYEDLDR